MAELKDVLAYILQTYTVPGDLSNGRVTKMVYLSDWRHILQTGRQVSGIKWKFDNFGPFVWDVVETAREHPDLFAIAETTNLFGSPKRVLSCINGRYRPRLSDSERAAIDHVVKTVQPLGWDEFIGLVYSTYPILASERYSLLDLESLAREYKQTLVYKSVVSV
jgi:hypothetical protein